MYKQTILDAVLSEYQAIANLMNGLDDSLEDIVQCIDQGKGKLIFIGIGKSGHIGEKLAATFASLGVPSFFVHAAEAVHGDLGMIGEADTVVLISNSGNTAEVANLVPYIQQITCNTIAFTADCCSELAKQCRYVLRYPKCIEADGNGVAPTCSTTAALVLGDAIACAIAKHRQFSAKDFHKYHPGGSLGKQLENI